VYPVIGENKRPEGLIITGKEWGIFASYQFLTGLYSVLCISKYLHVSKMSVTPQQIAHYNKARAHRTLLLVARLYQERQTSCIAGRIYGSRKIYIWSKIGVVQEEL
jgi:hypothetical protein